MTDKPADIPPAPASMSVDQALQRAVACHRDGQLQQAEQLYRAILEVQPLHADANHNLGALALGVGKPEVGLPFLRKALESHPEQRQYWLSYADALLQAGQWDGARQLTVAARQHGLDGDVVALLEARLAAPRAQARVHQAPYAAAIAKREAGQYGDAAALLLDRIDSHPQDADAFALLAQMYMLENRPAEAKSVLDRAAAIAPDAVLVKINVARLSLQERQLEHALKSAHEAYQVAPQNLEAVVVLAAALGANQRDIEAMRLIDMVLVAKPEYAEALANRALIHIRSGAPAAALADLESALAIKPFLKQLWPLVGALRGEKRDTAGAISALQTGLSLDPENVDLMTNLGNYLLQAKDLPAAVAILESATSKAPGNFAGWANLGAALQADGRNEAARQAYATAWKLNPGAVDVASNLGKLEFEERQWAQALNHFAHVLALQPNRPDILFSQALSLEALGRETEAVRAFQAYLVLKPEDPNGAGMKLAKLGVIALPARASKAHMETLYEVRANFWDAPSHYFAPDLVADAVARVNPAAEKSDILDAGCGTGLVALKLLALSRRMDGVDLSLPMIEVARKKNIYTALHVEDLVTYLETHTGQYDVVVSAATLIHFGDLAPIFAATATSLRDDGIFVFTLFPTSDDSGGQEITVAPFAEYDRGGCYAHSRNYVIRLAGEHGFAVEILETHVHEYFKGTEIPGLLVALRLGA